MKKLRLFLLAIIAFTNAHAQKLPNVQQVSLRAPANIKIDGKTTEFNNQFQAYNKHTDIYYTLSNDDKSLFLTIQTDVEEVINRISGGGITFKVKSANNTKRADVNVIYPVIDDKARLLFAVSPRKGVKVDTSAKVLESSMKDNNKKLNEYYKRIKVSGIKGLDTLSIYNDKGIAVAAAFDLKKALTLELSIPLKLLENLSNNSNTIFYEIKINGRKPIANPFFGIGPGAAKETERLKNVVDQLNTKLAAVTNFSGQYTLAKVNATNMPKL